MQADAEAAEGRLREIDADLRNVEELHRMRMQSNPDAATVCPPHPCPSFQQSLQPETASFCLVVGMT